MALAVFMITRFKIDKFFTDTICSFLVFENRKINYDCLCMRNVISVLKYNLQKKENR